MAVGIGWVLRVHRGPRGRWTFEVVSSNVCGSSEQPVPRASRYEQDALPDLGRACGHHIIETIGVGAGFASAKNGLDFAGRLTDIRTFAEEAGAGRS